MEPSLKISVLTPSFNTGKHLCRALDSVLMQNHPNVEHIVVDGGSTDATVDILTKYPHITWISEPDRGQSDAMNKAFQMATGDIIVYLNADDYFEPDVFSYVADFFKNHQETDILVGSLILSGGPDDRRIHVPSTRFYEVAYQFLYSFPFNPVSYFYRYHVQKTIGDFPINEHFAMDYWFLLRAFDLFKVHQTDQAFGVFFSDGTNKSCLQGNQSRLLVLSREYLWHHKGIHWILWFWILCAYRLLVFLPICNWKMPFKYLIYITYFRTEMSFDNFCRERFSAVWSRR